MRALGLGDLVHWGLVQGLVERGLLYEPAPEPGIGFAYDEEGGGVPTTRLAGRKAVVTGGTKGLGRAITQAFIREGCDVVAAARNADHAEWEMSIGPGKYLFHSVDVQDRASVDALMEYADLHLGGVDIVVANAGVSRPGPAATLPEEAWDEVIGTNLTGVFRCVQAAVPYLERSEHARLITMSSVLAGQVTPGAAVYSSSKAAVEAFTRVCAAELAPATSPSTVSPRASSTPAWAACCPATRRSGPTTRPSSPWAAWGSRRRWRTRRCSWPAPTAAMSTGMCWR